jgi:hypothetical protein
MAAAGFHAHWHGSYSVLPVNPESIVISVICVMSMTRPMQVDAIERDLAAEAVTQAVGK